VSTGAVIAISAFVALFGLVIWLGLRQSRELDDWLRGKVEHDGWVLASEDRLRSQADWHWLASLKTTRDVAVQSLAADPVPPESAFTLVTRRYGGRAGAARHVGVGLTTALPAVISPPLIASPVPSGGLGTSLKWFLGLDLPEVELSDPDLRRRWSMWSGEPVAARDLLAREPSLRSAFDALFGEVWNETRFQYLVLELNGDVAALIGGPKVVGRQPFEDLGGLARTFVDRLS
jgi:hypothetical protein